MNESYSGQAKVKVCHRLTTAWKSLADYFEIPVHERETERFQDGRGPEGVWEWIDEQGRLSELRAGLEFIGRDDLVEILDRDKSIEPLPAPEERPLTPPGLVRGLLDRVVPRLHAYMTLQGTLAEPAERAGLHEYLLGLCARIDNDFHNKVYLPLRSRSVPARPGLDEGDGFAPIHQVIRQLAGTAGGGDSASAQIAAVNRRSRVVRNILKELRRAEEPLVLLGDPGTGKTMTLLKVIRDIAGSESGRVFPVVPVYVRLGEFHVDGRVGPGDVREYVRHSVPPEIGRRLEALGRAGRLVVIFDGMDEMSRRDYSEHTEALSLYAGGAGGTKSLFSCRITDFSPKFIHRRLVLLPFDRAQIRDYLKAHLPAFPVRIGEESWSADALARRLAGGGLPMEPTNPFVLWLFCFRVGRTGQWPASRVDLLDYYVRETYEDKRAEAADDEHPLPGLDDLLEGLARLAFLITSRNLGSTIPVDDLLGAWSREECDTLILAGRRCRILVARLKDDRLTIRFEHHRFQEFFTALHLKRARPSLGWLDKLDAPRWQETMVNLVLMGGADDALRALAVSINALLLLHGYRPAPPVIAAPVRTDEGEDDDDEDWDDDDEDWNDEDWYDEDNTDGRGEIEGAKEERGESEGRPGQRSGGDACSPGPVPPASEGEESRVAGDGGVGDASGADRPRPGRGEIETFLADRVELASRIVRQCGAGRPEVVAVLGGSMRNAIEHLAETGNPITQVKMIRACQNLPGIDLLGVLRKPLESSVRWVRAQALILSAASPGSARAVGADPATFMGYDLANGLFLSRIKTYVKAAKAGGGQVWWCLLAGLACSLADLALLLGLAWALFAVARPVLPRHSSPLWVGGYGGAILTAATLSLRYQPGLLWAAILGTAFTLALVPALAVALWYHPSLWAIVAAAWFLLSGGWKVFVAATAIPGAIVHFTTLTTYLLLSRRQRAEGGPARTIYAAAWENRGFKEIQSETGVFKSAPVMLAIGVISPLVVLIGVWGWERIYPGVVWLAAWIPLPFPPWVNAALLLIVLTTLLCLVASAALRSRRPLYIPLAILAVAIGIAMIAAWLWIWFRALDLLGKLISYLEKIGVGFFVARCAVVLVCFACLTLVLVLLRRPCEDFARIVMSWARFFPDEFSLDEWAQKIQRSSPHRQAALLQSFDERSLKVKPEDYLRALTALEPHIEHEPASSIYWELRDRFEQVLRQGREG